MSSMNLIDALNRSMDGLVSTQDEAKEEEQVAKDATDGDEQVDDAEGDGEEFEAAGGDGEEDSTSSETVKDEPKRKNRAQDRIRDLVKKNKELEASLSTRQFDEHFSQLEQKFSEKLSKLEQDNDALKNKVSTATNKAEEDGLTEVQKEFRRLFQQEFSQYKQVFDFEKQQLEKERQNKDARDRSERVVKDSYNAVDKNIFEGIDKGFIAEDLRDSITALNIYAHNADNQKRTPEDISKTMRRLFDLYADARESSKKQVVKQKLDASKKAATPAGAVTKVTGQPSANNGKRYSVDDLRRAGYAGNVTDVMWAAKADGYSKVKK